jgi:hypothetical protein
MRVRGWKHPPRREERTLEGQNPRRATGDGELKQQTGATDFQGEQSPEGGFHRGSSFFGRKAAVEERQEGKGRRETEPFLERGKL